MKIELSTLNRYLRWTWLRLVRVLNNSGHTTCLEVRVCRPAAYYTDGEFWSKTLLVLDFSPIDEGDLR